MRTVQPAAAGPEPTPQPVQNAAASESAAAAEPAGPLAPRDRLLQAAAAALAPESYPPELPVDVLLRLLAAVARAGGLRALVAAAGVCRSWRAAATGAALTRPPLLLDDLFPGGGGGGDGGGGGGATGRLLSPSSPLGAAIRRDAFFAPRGSPGPPGPAPGAAGFFTLNRPWPFPPPGAAAAAAAEMRQGAAGAASPHAPAPHSTPAAGGGQYVSPFVRAALAAGAADAPGAAASPATPAGRGAAGGTQGAPSPSPSPRTPSPGPSLAPQRRDLSLALAPARGPAGRFLGSLHLRSARLSDAGLTQLLAACPRLRALTVHAVCEGGPFYAPRPPPARPALAEAAPPAAAPAAAPGSPGSPSPGGCRGPACACAPLTGRGLAGVAGHCPELTSVDLVLQHVVFAGQLRGPLAALGALAALAALRLELRRPELGGSAKAAAVWHESVLLGDAELAALLGRPAPAHIAAASPVSVAAIAAAAAAATATASAPAAAPPPTAAGACRGPPPLTELWLNRVGLTPSGLHALADGFPRLQRLGLIWAPPAEPPPEAPPPAAQGPLEGAPAAPGTPAAGGRAREPAPRPLPTAEGVAPALAKLPCLQSLELGTLPGGPLRPAAASGCPWALPALEDLALETEARPTASELRRLLLPAAAAQAGGAAGGAAGGPSAAGKGKGPAGEGSGCPRLRRVALTWLTGPAAGAAPRPAAAARDQPPLPGPPFLGDENAPPGGPGGPGGAAAAFAAAAAAIATAPAPNAGGEWVLAPFDAAALAAYERAH